MKTAKEKNRVFLVLLLVATAAVWLSGCVVVPADYDHDHGWGHRADWDNHVYYHRDDVGHHD